MTYIQNLRPKLFLLLFPLVVVSFNLTAQPSWSVESPRLRFTLDPVSGHMTMTARHAQGKAFYTTPLVISSGNIAQRWSMQRRASSSFLTSREITLEAEILSDRSIALTLSSADGMPRDLSVEWVSADTTAYYGGGERFNAVNHRGYILPMVSDDRYGNKGVGTHKPVPFVMGSHGVAVWVESYLTGLFDLDGSSRFGSVIRYKASRLRIVFIAGPELRAMLGEYSTLSGKAKIPPPWAFGLWKSRDVHHNRDSVLLDVENHRKHRIPASVLVLDSPWETGYNTFEVNRRQFRDAEAMFARVAALGFRLSLWLTPFINDVNVLDMQGIADRASNFDEAAGRGFLVKDSTGSPAIMSWWKGTGGLVDFTNPAATEWWFGQLDKAAWTGVRAFKADDGEGNFVPTAVFHDGSRPEEMKNRYGNLYNAMLQLYIDRRFGGDGVLITRSGTHGTQRYPFAWAGDNRGDFSFNDGLPSVIVAGQNAALSGIPLWGSDIAGYAGTPTKEVFVRWTQFGVFTPLMQVHMTSNLGPWDFDEETTEIFRTFAVLRTQLFPYLNEAVHEAANSGMPVIRPMVLAFPDDPVARRQQFQFMFGPDLLVAPMYQSGTRRSVYIPEGIWVNFWTGATQTGPMEVETEAPLEKIPLFVRAGAILPLIPEDVQTLVERTDDIDPAVSCLDDRRILQVWPGATGSCTTMDGLGAVRSTRDGRSSLRVESDRTRPVAVQLMYTHAEELSAPGGRIHRNAGAGSITVTYDRLTTSRTISWIP